MNLTGKSDKYKTHNSLQRSPAETPRAAGLTATVAATSVPPLLLHHLHEVDGVEVLQQVDEGCLFVFLLFCFVFGVEEGCHLQKEEEEVTLQELRVHRR